MTILPLVGLGVALLVVLTIALGVWIVSLRTVVPTNIVHIVQTSKKTIPYGRGRPAGNTYYAWPSWIPVIGIMVTKFPESIFKVGLEDYDAYDSARLPFIVDIIAFFRVEDAGTVAQRVESFGELNEQLRAVLQGSVRRILATNRLEDIMEERAAFGDQFTTEVKDQISEWGVVPVKTIEFMDIRDSRDSHVIKNIMAKEKSRIEKESRLVVADNLRDAELKEIDAQRTVEVQKQDALQQIGIRTAEKDKTVGISNEQAQQQIKEQARETAERDMAVKRVEETKRAEINRDVAVTKADENRQTTVITAEAARKSTELQSDAQLYQATKNAEGITQEGIARGAAEKALLMAPVDSQITLAQEIGENEGYQKYLITIRRVEAEQEVGIAMAKALENADLKVISNSGDVTSGVVGFKDVLSTKGGMGIGGMLEGLANSDEGRKLIDRFTGQPE